VFRAGIANALKNLSRGPRNPFLLVELAHAYEGLKEYARAEKLIEEALKMNPYDDKAYLVLANVYRGMNHPDAALIALNSARQLSPRNYLFIDKAIADVKEQMARPAR
jgi:tetratricopeptide (TPR) repeat protein